MKSCFLVVVMLTLGLSQSHVVNGWHIPQAGYSRDSVPSWPSLYDSVLTDHATKFPKTGAAILDSITSERILQTSSRKIVVDKSTSVGSSIELDSNFNACRFTAPSTDSFVYAGVKLKRTGTITNLTCLPYVYFYADTVIGGLHCPGGALPNVTNSFKLYAANLDTAYSEVIFPATLANPIVLIPGRDYWCMVAYTSTVQPVGGTVQWSKIDTGSQGVSKSTANTTWTTSGTGTGWIKLYKAKLSVTDSINSLGPGLFINTAAYGAALKISSYATKSNGNIGLQILSRSCAYGIQATNYHGICGNFSSTDGTAISASSSGTGGIAGVFAGGTGAGHGVTVTKGLVSDSLILSKSIYSVDSTTPPTPVVGTVATTTYYGVNGDTVMTVPKKWWRVYIGGNAYKIPLYQ
jgi:hypothetical protein